MPAKKSHPTMHRPSHPRCNFQFADGRRCRMLRDPRQQLCLFHHRELLQLESSEEIGAELLALGGNFQDPIALNFVLGKLFAHVATGRMHRRQASTLAYIAQLLLQTLDKRRYNLARDRYDYRAFIPALDRLYGREPHTDDPDSSDVEHTSDAEFDAEPESPVSPASASTFSSNGFTAAEVFLPTTTNAHQPPEPTARL